MSRRFWPVLAALLCLPFAAGANGCGSSSVGSSSGERKAELQLPNAPQPGGVGGKAAEGAKEEAITRKIIYSAAVEVVVKDVEQARADVERIVLEEAKGYIAKSDITGQVGSKRTATWTLKVPVEKFQHVVTALAALGKVTKNSSDSQDVTEEYVDLQARIKNLKVEEETLNKFLKDSVNSVETFLKTRDQIKTVRGEIERAEGRQKFLATMSAMSSVTFTAREEQAYDPAPPPAAATFGDDVDGTFTASWKALLRLGQGAVLFVVALAPWLPLIAIGLLAARFGWRRFSRMVAVEKPVRPMARAVRRVEPAAEVSIVDEPSPEQE